MISKELLSEVLNLNITYIEHCNNSIIYKISVYAREEEVNIYELAHKCKEWALNKGYQIISGLADEPAHRRSDEKAYAKINHYYGDSIDNLKYKYKIIIANTEVEVVIKASEYIY